MVTRCLTRLFMAVAVICFSAAGFAQEYPDQGNSDYANPPPDEYTQKQAAPADKTLQDFELEKARLDVEKARAEADRARAEAEAAKNFNANLKKNDRRNIKKNNNFTINPLGLVLGGIKIGYDRGLADLITLGLRAVYVAPLLTPFHAVGGEFALLFWPRHPNNGFFVGPFVQVSRTFPLDTSSYIGVTAVTPGAQLGWRWIWNSGFNLGLGGGFGWAFAVGDTSGGTIIGEGYYIGLLFDIGYAL